MSQPTDLVTEQAAYNSPYYGVAPIVDDVNPAGQMSVAGAAFNQVNITYQNVGPILDAGPVTGSVTEGEYQSNI